MCCIITRAWWEHKGDALKDDKRQKGDKVRERLLGQSLPMSSCVQIKKHNRPIEKLFSILDLKNFLLSNAVLILTSKFLTLKSRTSRRILLSFKKR